MSCSVIGKHVTFWPWRFWFESRQDSFYLTIKVRNKMGCFNVACSASKLTIGCGQKIVLFPLKIREEYTPECSWSKIHNPYYNTANFVSNDGPFGICQPFTLPIFGQYNDYGCVEEIEENEHTKYLEKYFGTSIYNIAEYFCRACCDGEEMIKNFPDPDKLKGIAGMFVLREVYDEYVKASLHEMKRTVYYNAPMDIPMLENLGFTYVEDSKNERFNKIYIHPSTKDYVMMSDERWSHIGKVNDDGTYTEVNTSTYHPSYVAEAWPKETGQTLKLDHLKDIPLHQNESLKFHDKYAASNGISLDDIHKELYELISKRQTKKNKERQFFLIEQITSMCNYTSDMDNRFWGKTFIDTYKQLFIDNHECISTLMSDYHLFYYIMFASNKLFIPSMHGFQHGDEDADIIVNEIALKIANQRKEDWIDENTCTGCGAGPEEECTCE